MTALQSRRNLDTSREVAQRSVNNDLTTAQQRPEMSRYEYAGIELVSEGADDVAE